MPLSEHIKESVNLKLQYVISSPGAYKPQRTTTTQGVGNSLKRLLNVLYSTHPPRQHVDRLPIGQGIAVCYEGSGRRKRLTIYLRTGEDVWSVYDFFIGNYGIWNPGKPNRSRRARRSSK